MPQQLRTCIILADDQVSSTHLEISQSCISNYRKSWASGLQGTCIHLPIHTLLQIIQIFLKGSGQYIPFECINYLSDPSPPTTLQFLIA